jgi:hypothetical protein
VSHTLPALSAKSAFLPDLSGCIGRIKHRTALPRQVECARGRVGAAAVAAPRIRLNLTQDEASVTEWIYAQRDPADELAELHSYSFKKRRPEGDIEFVITVKEFASRNALQMRFYAQADKEVNQKTAPFRPFGWGDTLLRALSECIDGIRKYPYDPE